MAADIESDPEAGVFETILAITTLLCGTVAGLLFGFAVVAMPGIASLPDRQFVRAFQVMDRVIQNNQPVFLLAWVGSVIGVIATVILGIIHLDDGWASVLLIAAVSIYLLGVQLPTAVVNIPLNNTLQAVDAQNSSDETLAAERSAFEHRWNRWNRIRTALALMTAGLLLVVLIRV